MLRSKKILAGIVLACVGWFADVPATAQAANTVFVEIDGQKQVFDQPPVIVNNRTLVPLRGIFESLHADVQWDQANMTVTATKGNTSISLQIGSKQASKNGQLLELDVEAQLVNNRTMVPARFVSEALGAIVKWDGEKHTVRIFTNGILNHDISVEVFNGDGKISKAKMQQVKQLLSDYNILDRISEDYQISFRQPIQIYLAADRVGYQQLLLKHGLSAEEAQKIVNGSDGLTIGNMIYLPLNEYPEEYALAGVLTHELVHVMFNQHKLHQIPSWVNEGLAWHTQLKVEQQGQPEVVRKGTELELLHSILQAKEDGKLIGLIDDYQETIDKLAASPDYNLEIQDWVAVEQLIGEYGMDAVLAYVNRLRESDMQAFQTTFGLSPQAFERQLNARLETQIQTAKKLNEQGVRITLEVTGKFQGELAVQPLNQRNVKMYRLQPGRYTAVIMPNGSVSGLGLESPVRYTGSVEPDVVYVMISPSGSSMVNGQSVQWAGFIIRHEYGKYYLTNGWITYQNGSVDYMDTDALLGVKIVDINE